MASNDQSESNFLIPILSAISGLGAIIAAISPVIFQNYIFLPIFIDSKLIVYASTVAVILVVVTLWLTSSISSFSIFNNAGNQSKTNLKLIVAFLVFSSLFYFMRAMFDAGMINTLLATSLQLLFYLLAFFFLSMVVGFMLRDSFQKFRRDQQESNKIDRIKDLLLKSGFIKIDMMIFNISQYAPQQGEYDKFGSKQLIVKIDNKFYKLVISSDYSQLQDSQEIPIVQQPQPTTP